ncbi:hypothetical protein AGR4C_Cc50175 [Agrobacterium tumefaciens str. Kerr 14]|uniref:Uncharacterized protein n=1 Tax=Agrobacterium tumefaciens str. Kerr 14 TaxID=1183424 RepID=A0A1S7PY14_AGRTU|nr:hypothetical protein AGR4C_Cc50175 [Agrobacterium tumefaciens str. Kerr 14]
MAWRTRCAWRGDHERSHAIETKMPGTDPAFLRALQHVPHTFGVILGLDPRTHIFNGNGSSPQGRE